MHTIVFHRLTIVPTCRLPDSERLLSNAEVVQILAERVATGKQTSKAVTAAEARVSNVSLL